ncbi:MAG: Uncharacterised protein [uncultured Bacteroidota bacterium]|nr:MAG: Uncharacterised protein [uncultured Bacteroidetes bacterium]
MNFVSPSLKNPDGNTLGVDLINKAKARMLKQNKMTF